MQTSTMTGAPARDAVGALADLALAPKAGDLGAATRAALNDCVLDCVAAALAGGRSAAAGAARAAARSGFGTGPCAVWFSGDRAPAAAAALANCAAASILDLDDGHRAAAGHPGAAIIPACLAVAEETGAGWDALASAIVMGYEVAVRVAAARDVTRLDTMSTGRWCNFGVAAATGRLRGLDRGQMAHALAIAGIHGPNQSASGYCRSGGANAKEGIPWSALTGALAVDLARAGFTGPPDILDHPDYYDSAAILHDPGARPAIEGVYFKPYSCCRWGHAAIDGLLAIMAREGLSPEAVQRVEIRTFSRALRLGNLPDPDTPEGAQYSIPFCLGLAACQGADAMLPIDAAQLHDPRSVAFARKVTLAVDPALDALFPGMAAARVRVHAAGGAHDREVLRPLGDPENPMSRARLLEKLAAAADGLPIDAVLAALARFEAGDHRPLLRALAAPALRAPG